MNMNEPPSLLRNDDAGRTGVDRADARGTRSNRARPGRDRRVTAGGRTQARAVLSQTSYYSHDDLRVHFGLGNAARVDRVEVSWPSGRRETFTDVPLRKVVTLTEGKGTQGL